MKYKLLRKRKDKRVIPRHQSDVMFASRKDQKAFMGWLGETLNNPVAAERWLEKMGGS
jgi:hypothetical protein